VTGALLEGIVRDAKRRQIRLLFVILNGEMSARNPSWRSTYLREKFRDLDVEFLDVRPALLEAVVDSDREWRTFFEPHPNNHPTAEGNALMARAIHSVLVGEPAAGWDEVVRLVRGGNIDRFAPQGWHVPGKTMTWSSEPRATLWIGARPDQPAELESELVNASRLHPETRTLRVAVSDHTVFETAVSTMPRGYAGWSVRVDVPPAALARPVVPVRFELPFVVRPAEVGTGKDERALGVAVRSVRLGPVQRGAARPPAPSDDES